MTDPNVRQLSQQVYELTQRVAAAETAVARPDQHRVDRDLAVELLVILLFDYAQSQGANLQVSAQQLGLIDNLRRYHTTHSRRTP